MMGSFSQCLPGGVPLFRNEGIHTERLGVDPFMLGPL